MTSSPHPSSAQPDGVCTGVLHGGYMILHSVWPADVSLAMNAPLRFGALVAMFLKAVSTGAIILDRSLAVMAMPLW